MFLKNAVGILTVLTILSGCNSVDDASTDSPPQTIAKEVLNESVEKKYLTGQPIEDKKYSEKIETEETIKPKDEEKTDNVKKKDDVEDHKDTTFSEYYDIDLSNSVQEHIINYSNEKDVPHTLVFALIAQESSFNKNAISSTSDYGLTQWNKPSGTFDWLRSNTSKELGISKSQVKWNNPIHNVTGGIWYLDWLRDYWINKGYTSQENLVALILLSYNMGIGNAGDYIKSNSPYDWHYVNGVLDYKAQLEQYKTIR